MMSSDYGYVLLTMGMHLSSFEGKSGMGRLQVDQEMEVDG